MKFRLTMNRLKMNIKEKRPRSPFNPLSPKSDQHQISPRNIDAL